MNSELADWSKSYFSDLYTEKNSSKSDAIVFFPIMMYVLLSLKVS